MNWIKQLFCRRRLYRHLSEEIQEHLEEKITELVASGMSREEATHAARREFGNATLIEERSREVWQWPSVENILTDVRYGLRMMRKNPGFTAVAVLTLTLGIGANTAIFSLIEAVMLRSLPVQNPLQLVLLHWSARHPPNTDGYWSSGDCADNHGFAAHSPDNPHGCAFSEPLFRRMAKTNAFSGVAAFANSGRLNLSGNGPATIIDGQFVSGGFFRTMGVKAAAGRVLEPNDDSPSAMPVAVLNYGYWQSALGGSRDAIGRTIDLNNVPFTIVGVAESRFTGISPGSDYDVWLPLSAGPRITESRFWANRQDDVGYWWLTIVGRLKARTGLAQAQAEVSGVFRNETLHGSVPLFNGKTGGGPSPQPGSPRGWSGAGDVASGRSTSAATEDNPEITLVPAQTGLTGQRDRFSNPLYVLLFAVGIILLIACANLAGLMLARAAARQREIAVRLALGAGRARVVRQLLIESVTLSVIGGAFGLLFAYWGARAIFLFVSSNQPRPLAFATGVDPAVLGFTVAVSLLTGILFGIAPAFRSLRVDLTPALKQADGGLAGSGHGGRKWLSIGNGLVVAQVVLAIVVLVGAGLLLRTLANLRNVDIGFNSRNIAIFRIDPTVAGYSDAQIEGFYRELQGRLAETPGVQAATYSMGPPLSGGMMATGFHWPGTPPDQQSVAGLLEVGPNFFRTLQIPLIGGRSFTAADFSLAARNRSPAPTATATPVIVNQAFVEKFLGRENPLGKQFGEAPAEANTPADPGHEIIGVVRDTKYNDLRRNVEPTIFSPQSSGGATFELRTGVDPRAMLPVLRKVVAEVNPSVPLFNVVTASEQIDRLLFQERLIARLSGFFAILALLLPCVGLYGLLSYEGSRRTHEIGVRMAMGASQGAVLKSVVARGLRLTVIGVGLGIAGALAVTRFLSSLLYGIKPTDLVTLVGVSLILGAVALIATYIPARRATKVDPMVALRYE
ncbi:MAG TPA: ABC transporter permease [Terriglobales bacterium]